MKRSLFFLAAFIAAVFSSCDKETDIDNPGNQGGGTETPSLEYEFTVNGDWKAGDAVSVWHGTDNFVYDGTFVCKSRNIFKGTLGEALSDGTEYTWYAVSPSAEGSPASCTVPVAAAQYGKAKSSGKDLKISMSTLTSYIKVAVRNATDAAMTAKPMSLSCSKAVFGYMNVNLTGEAAVWTDCQTASSEEILTDTEIELNAGETKEYTVSAAALAKTGDEVTLVVGGKALPAQQLSSDLAAGETVTVTFDLTAKASDVPDIETGTAFALSGSAAPIGEDTIADWMLFQLVEGFNKYTYTGWLNQGSLFCFGKNADVLKYSFSASSESEKSFGTDGGEFAMTVSDNTPAAESINKWEVTEEGYYELVFDLTTSKLKAKYLCNIENVFSTLPERKLYANVRSTAGSFPLDKGSMTEMTEDGNGIWSAMITVPADYPSGQLRIQMDFGGDAIPAICPSAECSITVNGLEETPIEFKTNGNNLWFGTDAPGHSYKITLDLISKKIWAKNQVPPLEATEVLLKGPAIGVDWGADFVHMKRTDNKYVFEAEVSISGTNEMFTIHLDNEQRSIIPFLAAYPDATANGTLVEGNNKFKYYNGPAPAGWFVPNIPAGKYRLTVDLEKYILTCSSI